MELLIQYLANLVGICSFIGSVGKFSPYDLFKVTEAMLHWRDHQIKVWNVDSLRMSQHNSNWSNGFKEEF